MRESQTNLYCKNLILYYLVFVCKYKRKRFSNIAFTKEFKFLFSETVKRKKGRWDNAKSV